MIWTLVTTKYVRRNTQAVCALKFACWSCFVSMSVCLVKKLPDAYLPGCLGVKHIPLFLIPARFRRSPCSKLVQSGSNFPSAVFINSVSLCFCWQDLIYTRAGPVLIAVNPFKKLPSAYGQEILQRYRDSTCTQPHVFLVVRLRAVGISFCRLQWRCGLFYIN